MENTKLHLLNEWSENFKELFPYAKGKLYKQVGVFLMGIELIPIRGGEGYRPTLVMYPLWKDDIKQCLSESILIQEFYSKQNLQCNILYENSDNFSAVQFVMSVVREQAAILFCQYIMLADLILFFDKRMSDVLVKSSPVMQAKLIEAKLMASLFVKNMEFAQKILLEASDVSKSWNPVLFEWKFGSFEIWLEGLKEYVDNPDLLLTRVVQNKADKKIRKIHGANIV